MSFNQLLNQKVSIYRKTDIILDSCAISASMSPTYQPSRAAYMQVQLSSLVGTGTVTIVGSSTETLNVSSSRSYESTSSFTSIASITTSGISGTIKIKAIELDGSPIYAHVLVNSEVDARFSKEEMLYRTEETGGVILGGTAVFLKPEEDVAVADRIVDSSGVKYVVKEIRKTYDSRSLHHLEAQVKRERQ